MPPATGQATAEQIRSGRQLATTHGSEQALQAGARATELHGQATAGGGPHVVPGTGGQLPAVQQGTGPGARVASLHTGSRGAEVNQLPGAAQQRAPPRRAVGHRRGRPVRAPDSGSGPRFPAPRRHHSQRNRQRANARTAHAGKQSAVSASEYGHPQPGRRDDEPLPHQPGGAAPTCSRSPPIPTSANSPARTRTRSCRGSTEIRPMALPPITSSSCTAAKTSGTWMTR